MLVLNKFFLFSLVALLFAQGTTNPKQELNDQLFEAVRKGDAAAVTALLDKGADANAKFRYGQTALFKAAEKGYANVAKILIDRGVDVTVKDTFYGATAISWAMNNNHPDVVKLIFEKDASSVDEVLLTGARGGNEELVKIALERGGAKPQTLTTALVAAMADPKYAAIAEMLKKAGAVAPPQIDEATLQSYVGTYKGEPGPELKISIKEGKLIATSPQSPQPITLVAIDKTSFRPAEFDGITLTFNVENGNVTGMTFKQGPSPIQMKRVAETKP